MSFEAPVVAVVGNLNDLAAHVDVCASPEDSVITGHGTGHGLKQATRARAGSGTPWEVRREPSRISSAAGESHMALADVVALFGSAAVAEVIGSRVGGRWQARVRR